MVEERVDAKIKGAGMGSHQRPREVGESVVNLAELIAERARRSAFLQGRKSAEPTLAKNTVNDGQVVQAILRTAFSFSEFQQLGYFHSKAGYFEKLVDFEEEMPLPSTLLSPLYGKFIAEMVFAAYVRATLPYAAPPVVVSLGAGRGVLDFDLIRHLTDSSFESPDFQAHARVMREMSTFIVSDRTEKSLEMLASELSPLIRDPTLPNRVRIMRLNSLDFKLGPFPLGVVHSNELIDALPTEPVVKKDGRLYSVRIMAYDTSGSGEHSEDVALVSSRMGVPGLLTAKAVKERVDSENYDRLRFLPVFVPLESDERLSGEVSRTPSVSNIDSEAFGGIYPLCLGLEGLFLSVRQSFEHGAVIIVDYVSYAEGRHNWNTAVNIFGNHEFGKEDIDFQIDAQQVIDKATATGLVLESRLNMGAELQKTALPLLKAFTQSDVARVSEKNRFGQTPASMLTLALLYSVTIKQVLSGYELMIFTF